ncbi:MAG: hypothetical protein AAF533_04830 [Acidobacteriota bacterium]
MRFTFTLFLCLVASSALASGGGGNCNFCFTCNNALNGLDTTAPYVFSVTEPFFGAIPSDGSDDYCSLLLAAEYINTCHPNDDVTLIYPYGEYNIKPFRCVDGPTAGPDASGVSHIAYRRITGPLLIQGQDQDGDKPVITIDGGFDRRRDESACGNTNSSVIPFFIHDSTNIRIENIELDGGARNITESPNGAGDMPRDGAAMGIATIRSTKLDFVKVDAHHFVTDGFYIGGGEYPDKYIGMLGVSSRNNGRAGVSVILAKHVDVSWSDFSWNGYTGGPGAIPGSIAGRGPGVGFNVEPNSSPDTDCRLAPDDRPTDIEVRNCTFTDNRWNEITVGAKNWFPLEHGIDIENPPDCFPCKLGLTVDRSNCANMGGGITEECARPIIMWSTDVVVMDNVITHHVDDTATLDAENIVHFNPKKGAFVRNSIDFGLGPRFAALFGHSGSCLEQNFPFLNERLEVELNTILGAGIGVHSVGNNTALSSTIIIKENELIGQHPQPIGSQSGSLCGVRTQVDTWPHLCNHSVEFRGNDILLPQAAIPPGTVGAYEGSIADVQDSFCNTWTTNFGTAGPSCTLPDPFLTVDYGNTFVPGNTLDDFIISGFRSPLPGQTGSCAVSNCP